jgi:DNA repair/transcription protein MET18/MMS19
MGDDFVSSYIKLAEGEKDPRNLLLAFSINHVVLVDFDIHKHLEVILTASSASRLIDR